MANLLAIMVHCPGRGSEMICGDTSHVHMWEQGNNAWLAGKVCRLSFCPS